MCSAYQNASIVGGYVNRKVLGFQRRYLSNGHDASEGRATLARLRKLGTAGGSLFAAGSELFADLPDLALDPKEEKRVLNTVMAAFRLYARHQQSESVPMAICEQGDEDARNALRRSFGWSCWKAGSAAGKRGQDKAPGIKRRLASLETASDFDGIELQLRGLISIVKTEDVPVDYFLLARDLYLLQIPSCRKDVFLRWSRDFYWQRGSNEPQNGPADE